MADWRRSDIRILTAGNRLEQIRREKGYTQEELARLADISLWSVGAMEAQQNDHRVRHVEVRRLAAALRVNIDYLLGKQPEIGGISNDRQVIPSLSEGASVRESSTSSTGIGNPLSPEPRTPTVSKVDHQSLALNADSIEPQAKGIRVYGEDADRLRRALRHFYEIGCEYKRGARSLQEASKWLEKRSIQGGCPRSIPVSCGQASRTMKRIREFFLSEYGLDELFTCGGQDSAFEELTANGWTAWRLTEDFLLAEQLIGKRN